MKLNLTQENLNRALSIVGRAVSNRSSLPVLSNVLLSTDQGRLRLAATNLEIGINYWIGGQIENDGAITVPARLFSDFVASLPGGNLELSTTNASLKIKTPHYESTINGIAADEFPLIPELKTKPIITIPAETLREVLSQVTPAASLDEARPVLAGVYLYLEKDLLVAVATDSYRLAEKKIKLKKAVDAKLSVIVPARTMQELIRVLSETEDEVSLYLGDNQVMFKTANIELTSRLIEGQFPDYRQIIPAQTETEVKIPTADLSRVTKVASLFARESAGSIRIEIKADGLVNIISSAPQVGENVSSAEGDVAGDDTEVSLNSRYLTEALSLIKTEEVIFATSGKLNPCVIKPVAKSNPADYLHIIMPLRT